jgi:hypothetical protein
MNETVALQCLRVIEDVIASCVFYKSLILENQDQLLKLVQALPWLIGMIRKVNIVRITDLFLSQSLLPDTLWIIPQVYRKVMKYYY